MNAVPAPGAVLDGFVLGERIAGGTMANVFRASRPDVGFPLVLKLPRLGQGETGASVVSHEVEQQVLERLGGRHVPRFVAAGPLERTPYIAMEYVEGESLEAWAARAPLAPADVARVGAALATALHSIHQQEAIHLDVKPANVLLRPGGEAVLLDFGLSHHARLPDLLAEEFRRPIGTAPYISPEQVLGVRSECRSDLFSAGVVLYQLATGRLPFGAPDSPRGMRARLHREPEPPRRLLHDFPEWLQEVILRCLEPDARDRHASAAALAFDLTHPGSVLVGLRGRRSRRAGLFTRAARWLRSAGYEPKPAAAPAMQAHGAPVVVIAARPGDIDGPRSPGIAATVRRALAAGESRAVFVTVIRPVPEWGTDDPEETPAAVHLRALVALRRWAGTMDLPADRVSFHVLESTDAHGALLEYVRANAVDELVVASGPLAARVAAEAPCSVTIVRTVLSSPWPPPQPPNPPS